VLEFLCLFLEAFAPLYPFKLSKQLVGSSKSGDGRYVENVECRQRPLIVAFDHSWINRGFQVDTAE